MKKKLIIMGIGLAVVGTGIIVKKLRNKKNNKVEETMETEEAMDVEIVEEVIENEVEEIVVDNDEEIEILDCEENYVPEENKVKNFIMKRLERKINKLMERDRKLNDIDNEKFTVDKSIPVYMMTKTGKILYKIDYYKKQTKLMFRYVLCIYTRYYIIALGFIGKKISE